MMGNQYIHGVMDQKIIYWILGITFISCAGKEKISLSGESAFPKYQILARSKYQADAKFVFNNSGTHVLCLKVSLPTIQRPSRTVLFFVYDIQKEKILYEDSVVDGTVRWLNNSTIEVQFTPGIVIQDEDPAKLHRYIYNVDKEEKTVPNSESQ